MFDTLDESLGFVINKTALALKKALEKNLKPVGLTAVQFAILKRLWEEDGLSQKEIADRTFKNGAEITLLVDKLVAKGLVIRDRDMQDRRAYRIVLTQKGRALETEVVAIAVDTLKQSLKGVDDADAQRVLKVMEMIYRNVE